MENSRTVGICAVFSRHLLDDKGLVLVINDLWQRCRNGVVRSWRLCDQAQITFEARVDCGFLDLPLTNIAEDFALGRRFLGSLASSPAVGPVL